MTQATSTTCIFWNIFCRTPKSPFKRHFYLPFYAGTLRQQNPLLQVCFYEWQTITIPDKTVTDTRVTSFSWKDSVPSIQGRRNTWEEGVSNCQEQIWSLNDLSNTLKFLTPQRHFLLHGLNRDTSKLRHSKQLKKYEPC